jgi:hypothetical protein
MPQYRTASTLSFKYLASYVSSFPETQVKITSFVMRLQ